LNNVLNNKEFSNNYSVAGLSSDKEIKDQRNIINSIIKGNPSKTKMTIDQNIAIQIASLEIILNDYLINNNKKSNIVINPSNNNTDCKDDYNCFIEKSKTCSQAKMQIDRISNFF